MKIVYIRYLAALVIAISYNLFSLLLSPLTVFVSASFLQLFYDIIQVGNTITINAVPFVFIPACTATLAYILLAELLLVTRGISFSVGARMFLLGSLGIFIMNIARIIFLIMLYFSFGENYFDAVHIFFWQAVSTVFVAVIWIILVERYKIKTIPIYDDMKELLKG